MLQIRYRRNKQFTQFAAKDIHLQMIYSLKETWCERANCSLKETGVPTKSESDKRGKISLYYIVSEYQVISNIIFRISTINLTVIQINITLSRVINSY